MTLQKFQVVKALIAAVLAALMAMAVIRQNYILAVAAVVIAVLLIMVLRRQVKEVVADERDLEASGKAARMAISIFSVLACLLAFPFLIFRTYSPDYELVGSTLAYSACALLILYSLMYKYYESGVPKGSRAVYIISVAILVFVLFIIGARFLSGEDTWICQNGQWVKHGVPEAPMPTTPCK